MSNTRSNRRNNNPADEDASTSSGISGQDPPQNIQPLQEVNQLSMLERILAAQAHQQEEERALRREELAAQERRWESQLAAQERRFEEERATQHRLYEMLLQQQAAPRATAPVPTPRRPNSTDQVPIEDLRSVHQFQGFQPHSSFFAPRPSESQLARPAPVTVGVDQSPHDVPEDLPSPLVRRGTNQTPFISRFERNREQRTIRESGYSPQITPPGRQIHYNSPRPYEAAEIGLSSQKATHSQLKVPNYNGSVPWAEFERQFQIIAEINNWDPPTKAGMLAGCLSGPALSILTALDKTEIKNFEKLSSSLRLRFGKEHLSKLYQTQFETRRQQQGEDLASLGQDIERLARLALPICAEEDRDRLACGRFINAINDNALKLDLSLAGPTSLKAAIIKSLEIQALRRAFAPDSASVRQLGNSRNNDFGNREIQRSGDSSRRRVPTKYPIPPVRNTPRQQTTECGYCGGRTHATPKCFKLLNALGNPKPREDFCPLCERQGHNLDTCRSLARYISLSRKLHENQPASSADSNQ